MNLENQLLLGYIIAEAVFICLLVYRRAFRLLPIFAVYCCWDLAINIATFPISHYFPNRYMLFYVVDTALDSALQFCVLVELAWSVLRPIRSSLPRRTLLMIPGALLILGAAIWPFSGLHQLVDEPSGLLLLHLLQTVSVLRILFFLALAGCSQFLSLSWRDRELQIITGLGIYSTMSLAIAVYRTHQAAGYQNKTLNEIVVASYICSLVYWVVCYSQREQERKEFTPQMQNLLLAMAGVARADREALAQRSVTNSKDKPVVWPPR